MSEKASKKTHKISVAKPTRNQTKFEMANNAILKMYDITVAMLQEGISKGSTNSPLGIISFMAYVDLLHGGAYAVPVNQRPFYIQDKTKSPYYAGNLINTDAAQGVGGWLGSILGGLNAGPLVQEVLEDANVPHIFPKLISDEMYAILKCVFAWFTTTDLLKNAGTGVKTFVEAGARGLEAVGTTAESLSKAAKTAMPSPEQIQALLPLLTLLEGA